MTPQDALQHYLVEKSWQRVGLQERWLWHCNTGVYITLHEDGVKLSRNKTKRAAKVLYSDPNIFEIIEEFLK